MLSEKLDVLPNARRFKIPGPARPEQEICTDGTRPKKMRRFFYFAMASDPDVSGAPRCQFHPFATTNFSRWIVEIEIIRKKPNKSALHAQYVIGPVFLQHPRAAIAV
jgi:hypothetical protein